MISQLYYHAIKKQWCLYSILPAKNEKTRHIWIITAPDDNLDYVRVTVVDLWGSVIKIF